MARDSPELPKNHGEDSAQVDRRIGGSINGDDVSKMAWIGEGERGESLIDASLRFKCTKSPTM